MAEGLYSKRTHAQWRGPTTSDKYNERIENAYKDHVNLLNKTGRNKEELDRAVQRVNKDQLSMVQAIEDLEERVAALEADQKKISFFSDGQIDIDRFDGTAYEIAGVDKLYHDSRYGLVTLPKVLSSSVSKVYFTNSDGEHTLPSTFEVLVKGVANSADTSGALIDTTNPHLAFFPDSKLVWQRNVIVDNIDTDGAIVQLYVKLPIDLLINADTNVIAINPFPIMGCELVEVAYSTDQSPLLNDTDNYDPINAAAYYTDEANAIGWVAPGGWDGDEIMNCGPRAFYFEPRGITAVRITLRQRSYYAENAKYVYPYGLALLDIRYDKFLDTGKALLRFDAPQGDTISNITNVLPQIWNVSEAELPNVFDYRILWETAFDSGIYTTTPVAFSSRVWIEVTLSKTLRKATPALSGLVISYT